VPDNAVHKLAGHVEATPFLDGVEAHTVREIESIRVGEHVDSGDREMA